MARVLQQPVRSRCTFGIWRIPGTFVFLHNPVGLSNLYYNSAQSLRLNSPPLSNFVDRGLGEWEWLGPGSTKISAHGPPKWYF
jgi:hypothetical protein